LFLVIEGGKGKPMKL